ncbi:VOC family protein [Jannaschia pohangensis]|uniref:Glyoxalase/Bleomycin resistance protein/Dioxygenase superfamily protein n=1 Tax=Jannaschia pohangensis TaxID=390807 RepID=A0A1I3QBF8_9RHOB|nr:VOC family protein [Jannaschia pohangensis]SFJ30651.1 Glyoxalase/Bleomycin resistance protein/Dioxygenase superfamily protein [Jannaschia pohangensis]
MARLEHLNITVRDPDAVAEELCTLLDWRIRWAGPALGQGRSVHVGTDDAYVALYRPEGGVTDPTAPRHQTHSGANHIGVVVDDIVAAEARVTEHGYVPHSHAEYAPGKRFYFEGPEGVEIEVVAYP